MIKRIILVCVMIVLTACHNIASQQKDNSRIISTTVATTEVLAQLDLDIVGKPKTAKVLPEKYHSIPEVGMAKNLDVEKIKALKPTRILSLESIKVETQDTFKQLGVEADYYNFDTVNKMMSSIEQMGRDFNRVEQAKKLNNRFSQVLDKVKQQQPNKRLKVLVLMGVPGSYLVATNQSYIGNMVEILGAKNVVESKEIAYLSSNTEYLNNVQPDIILRQSHAMPQQVVDMFNEMFNKNQIWHNMPAVRQHHVYDLNPELFGINARINADEAMRELYRILYGVELNE